MLLSQIRRTVLPDSDEFGVSFSEALGRHDQFAGLGGFLDRDERAIRQMDLRGQLDCIVLDDHRISHARSMARSGSVGKTPKTPHKQFTLAGLCIVLLSRPRHAPPLSPSAFPFRLALLGPGSRRARRGGRS